MDVQQFGRYTLISRLGTGGMAEVFLAKTSSVAGFQKRLAIKRLLPYCTEDPQTAALLADEARIAVHLTHPNIVQVFDFGRVGETYFIAMEYVEGLDLRSLMGTPGQAGPLLPTSVALYITASVLEGLSFAHGAKDNEGRPLAVIHRDVTPHNVLISRHGEVKLTDFGVARAAISSHQSVVGEVLGKFSYMPPEQVSGGRIDHRVDIFATGAILYELLAGKPPYRSASVGEQLRHLDTALAPPSHTRGDLAQALDAITMQALAPDPAQRFASAHAFSAALQQHLREHYAGGSLTAKQLLAGVVEDELHRRHGGPATAELSTLVSLAEYPADPTSLIADARESATREPQPAAADRHADRARQTSAKASLEPGEAIREFTGAADPYIPRAARRWAQKPPRHYLALALLLLALTIGIVLAVWIATAPVTGS